jgi:hypothetical protein
MYYQMQPHSLPGLSSSRPHQSLGTGVQFVSANVLHVAAQCAPRCRTESDNNRKSCQLVGQGERKNLHVNLSYPKGNVLLSSTYGAIGTSHESQPTFSKEKVEDVRKYTDCMSELLLRSGMYVPQSALG